ncbi:hypothetical protein Sru01_68140 [Sphaerisporangium rufum]|uniref:Shikimate dehydrogenase n=1 Tax=Sphaerisporangium rufum TaxID=1381558 RepID=A0A919RD33_9ACTN|nr:hypothetical protein [Sphaerisporangium rufum]GII81832.1 hypothetical protein Sru01_68140 [Sphaerisporangium rufum]
MPSWQAISTTSQQHAGTVAREALYFVGVTTSGSSIMTLFPAWARHLGLDARITGIDVPLGAEPAAYRACVKAIADDPAARGALVTTHKSAVFEAAGDLFSELDPYAGLCREVSCIVSADGQVRGSAKDPLTAGLTLDHMLGSDHWASSGGHVVCFGAGGAGLAIMVRLLSEAHRPERVVLVDRDPRRTDVAREVAAEMGVDAGVEFATHGDPVLNDALVAAAPPGSLVINATGMGKDLPGSPVSAEVRFPAEAVVWDLNYRGDLVFVDHARAQTAASGLTVHDGWRYFLHGWTEVIAEVFGLPMTPELFGRLARVAEPLSGRAGAGGNVAGALSDA